MNLRQEVHFILGTVSKARSKNGATELIQEEP